VFLPCLLPVQWIARIDAFLKCYVDWNSEPHQLKLTDNVAMLFILQHVRTISFAVPTVSVYRPANDVMVAAIALIAATNTTAVRYFIYRIPDLVLTSTRFTVEHFGRIISVYIKFMKSNRNKCRTRNLSKQKNKRPGK